MAFKLREVKSFILENYQIQFNKFAGCYYSLAGSKFDARPLEEDDFEMILSEAKKEFPELTMYGVKKVLLNTWGADRLRGFGIENGLNFQRLYGLHNIALYLVTGENKSNIHYRVRHWKKEADFFIEKVFTDKKSAIEEMNNYYKTLKPSHSINEMDLVKLPYIFDGVEKSQYQKI